MFITHLLYPFLCQWTLGCFYVLAVVNSAAMNAGVHVPFQIMVFSGHMPRSEIAESYGNSIFNFLRNLHTVFHSGYINLHSYQQCTSVPFTTYPRQYLSSLVFLLIAILTCVIYYHIMVLIYFFEKTILSSLYILGHFVIN